MFSNRVVAWIFAAALALAAHPFDAMSETLQQASVELADWITSR
ncbi:MAG: hypothetical protein RIT81_46195 [Deltaproteobacteria bacterium]